MNLEFDPGLVESVIFKELKSHEEKGDFRLTDEYHSLADPVYDNFLLDERPAQFRKIEWDFFKKLGFLKYLNEIFDEFGELNGKVAGAVIIKARSLFEEGSDLSKGPSEDPVQKRIVVKLLCDRFQELPYLKKMFRHELMHVSDMLNPLFGYKDERLGGNPMEESIVREKYSVFWDIFVDSRLIRKGLETTSDKDSRYREFESQYKKIPADIKHALFENLWNNENLTHAKIFDMAKDVNHLMKIIEGLSVKPIQKAKKQILPGAQCPLCQFRTFDWAEKFDPGSQVVAGIKKDFPDWEPDDGVCERCAEVYLVNVPVC